ncbi:MAG: LamG domain-containing protein, partial [Acidobacteriota bacterium]
MSKPNEKLGTREKLDISRTGFRDGSPVNVSSPLGEGVAFGGKICFDAGNVGNFNFRDRLVDYKDQFAISAWFRAEQEQSGAIVTRIKDISFEKDNNLPKARGYGLFLNNGKLHFNIVGVWADDSWRVETVDPVSLRQWHHVVAVFDSTLPYEKARIYLDGRLQTLKINNGRLFRTFNDDSGLLRIGGGGGPEYRFRGDIDEVRIYKSALAEEMLGVLACADSIQTIARITPAKRSRSQQLKLVNEWIAAAAPEAVRDAHRKWRSLIEVRGRLESEFPTVMVM